MNDSNPHSITRQFEQVVADYTGAPYAVAIDNCSNALFLALMWWRKTYLIYPVTITIPSHTYPSVPCEIIHAGMRVKFDHWAGNKVGQLSNELAGEYNLSPTNIWDSSLRFTSGMYQKGQIQCLSFTGPKKHLKLGKGGMILTDSEAAYRWFKRARFSGRNECSYHDDDFDIDPVIGWNFYMMPEVAARGLLLMTEFPKHNEDLTIKYPDLSKFKLWK